MLQINAGSGWTLNDLARIIESAEIRADDGKLIGVFVPANLERGEQIKAESKKRIDPVEIERLKQSSHEGDLTWDQAKHIFESEESVLAFQANFRAKQLEKSGCVAP